MKVALERYDISVGKNATNTCNCLTFLSVIFFCTSKPNHYSF